MSDDCVPPQHNVTLFFKRKISVDTHCIVVYRLYSDNTMCIGYTKCLSVSNFSIYLLFFFLLTFDYIRCNSNILIKII